nr:olfactory receptor 2D3 [Equus caballus]
MTLVQALGGIAQEPVEGQLVLPFKRGSAGCGNHSVPCLILHPFTNDPQPCFCLASALRCRGNSRVQITPRQQEKAKEKMTDITLGLKVLRTECALLAVMSYDRYVAVCKPLHYSTIMTQQMCLQLTIGSWVSGALVSLVDTTFTFQLPYGGQNIINHYFCEPPALLKLASADTYSTEMAIFAMGVLILLAPVSLILVSYWNIISTVIQMQSGEGTLKAFSTCGSHLIVVVLFYGSGIFTYMRPNSKTTKEQDKMISVFYTVVTPMLNPIIYSLKNKDVKRALRKLAGRKSFSQRQ